MRARKQRNRAPAEAREAQRKYKRVVLTYFDLIEARSFLVVLRRYLQSDDPSPDERLLIEALSTATVVAYARPFSGNHERKDAAASVGRDLLPTLSTEQRRWHDRVIELRRTQFAHTDSEAANVNVSVIPDWRTQNVFRALPVSNALRAPLTVEFTDALLGVVEELIKQAVSLQLQLDPIVTAYGSF